MLRQVELALPVLHRVAQLGIPLQHLRQHGALLLDARAQLVHLEEGLARLLAELVECLLAVLLPHPLQRRAHLALQLGAQREHLLAQRRRLL